MKFTLPIKTTVALATTIYVTLFTISKFLGKKSHLLQKKSYDRGNQNTCCGKEAI